MDLRVTFNRIKKIRFFLIFFLFFVFVGCKKQATISDFKVKEVDGKIIAITFKSNLKNFQLRLKDNTTEMLGSIKTSDETFEFRPIVPFSKGMTYEIWSDYKLLKEFKVESNFTDSKVEVINIYPTRDTIPQNLLKIYIEFSEPMQAIGNSSDYVKVKDKQTGTETSIFLNLENELWNEDRTMLTLWLDPGRIKQDLIPNQKLGLPLIQGKMYNLVISKEWKSSSGKNLENDYEKQLIVTDRDDSQPNIKNWQMQLPNLGTKERLRIEFGESLDAQLLLETIIISKEKDEIIKGEIIITDQEAAINFKPNNQWKKGNYRLRVQSKLEDLAGNNLNRLFDTDLNDKRTEQPSKEYQVIPFKIE